MPTKRKAKKTTKRKVAPKAKKLTATQKKAIIKKGTTAMRSALKGF